MTQKLHKTPQIMEKLQGTFSTQDFRLACFHRNYPVLKAENLEILISYGFQIMVFFHFIIVAVESIQGGKLFKGGNYSRKYGSSKK